MPIYEYQCAQCDSQFELLVRDSEQPSCPHCDSADLEKQLSIVAAPKSGGGQLPMATRSNAGAG